MNSVNSQIVFLDTTVRPICFPELGREYSKEQAKTVGAEQFKRYEYLLYLMAQLARLVYSDTGVIWSVAKTGLGLSNDIVNKIITVYDKKFAPLSRKPMPSPPGIKGRPMQSYVVPNQPQINMVSNYATYVSTSEDVTCLMLDASVLKPNLNSILTNDDILISFKGSSTIQNFLDDVKAIKPTNFSNALQSIGLDIPNLGNVAGGFVFPLLRAMESLQTALKMRLDKKQSNRLFITGHSLGGAYATFFGWILALLKKSDKFPELQAIQSFHIITYGAPLLFSDTARNQFNALLDEGVLTLDRVVSQQIASVKSAIAGTAGKMASGADFIPTIPVGFSHPGFQPLVTEFFPEKNGRPYGMKNIRSTYGVESAQRYRNSATWPFEASMEMGNISKGKNLDSIVSDLTHISLSEVEATNEKPMETMSNTSVNITPPSSPTPQQGGVFGIGQEKTKYEQITKKRIPNFVSVIGSNWALSFPHAEYLGMFFMGAFRLAGRKNPGIPGYTATFHLTNEGVQIEYNFGKLSGGRRQNKSRKRTIKRRTTRRR